MPIRQNDKTGYFRQNAYATECQHGKISTKCLSLPKGLFVGEDQFSLV